jgi:tetratricopeptide (TPR) repeat protein
LAIVRRVYGDKHEAVADAMGGMVGAALGADDFHRTDSLARGAIAMLREIGSGRSPTIVPIMNDLALSRMYQGDYQEATSLMRQVVALDSAHFGPAHPDLAAHLENLSLIYSFQGRLDSSTVLLHQVLDMRRKVLPDDNPAIGRTIFNLASAEYGKGDYAAAQPLFEESLERMRKVYGPEHPDVVWATASMGKNLYRLGRLDDAERDLRWALDVKDPNGQFGPRDYTLIAPYMVSVLMDRRRWAEAEPIALRVLAIRDSLADTLSRQSAEQLVKLYQGWGKPDRAAEFRKRAEGGATTTH